MVDAYAKYGHGGALLRFECESDGDSSADSTEDCSCIGEADRGGRMDLECTRWNSGRDVFKEVLTPEELAEVLGISVWTVYAKTSRRNRGNTSIELPPFFRLGKLIRFYRKDLVSWLESRKRIDPNKGES